jgi:hypothetical protein
MFHRQTLFVVGAGASAEVDMPVGTELAASIAKKMDIRFEFGGQPIDAGDLDLYSNIRQSFREEAREYQQAGWLIRDGLGLSLSIDDFLDVHRANERANRYGKAAIVKAVLEAERHSRLYFDPNDAAFNPASIADTWLIKFMHMLGRGVPKENARQTFDKVSFVIFNYDRCVEHFLLHSLQKLYGIFDREASAILDDVSAHIIHPYGTIGELQTLPFGGGGGSRFSANYIELAKGIKTYTEQKGASDLSSMIDSEMQMAECIVFLGFAYHSQNMGLIAPSKPMPHKPVFGTAYGLSESDTDVVSNQIAQFFTPNMSRQMRSEIIRLEKKLKSADLFDYYGKSLTGGD